jgi:xylulokinase
MYGSTTFIIALAAGRVRDRRLWYAPWVFPGEHGAAAGLASSGTLNHWFCEQFARGLDPVTAVITLAAEAEASPPAARGLVVLPYFSGERTPIHDPRAHGVIFGLDLTHTRGDIYRAVFEGIACATNHVFETHVEAGQEPRCLLAAAAACKTESGRRRRATSRGADRESERKRWAPPMATPSSPLLPSAMSAEATSAHGTRLPTRSFPTTRHLMQ